MENREEKDIILAYFDILGTSKRLEKGSLQEVYDFYQYMVKLCSDDEIPMAIPNRLAHLRNLPELRNLLGGYQSPFLVISFPLKHAFFSDTFILWVEYDNFTQATLDGFAERVNIIFCEALKRKIPIRGLVTRGKAIMDEENKLYLGLPIVEAARTESVQEWLGISLGNSCKGSVFLNIQDTTIPYDAHIKEGKENTVSELVLDWPKWWREHESISALQIIDEMNTDPKYSKYYDNTKRFVLYSEKGTEVWNQQFAKQ